VSTEEPMSVEDRVRTATRVGATLVRDIRPLAEPERVRLGRRPAPAARRWGAWGVPLAAAAAVVLVAVGLVAVRHLGATGPAAPRPVASSASVPRYYAVLDETGAGVTVSGTLIVGDDLTGKTVAIVSAPPGMHFARVQGSAGDRTFVVMATPKGASMPPETWYLLRIAPGTAHPYQLSKLAIKLPDSSPDGLAYALSPDDGQLAIESLNNPPSSGITLGIYSVSSGARLHAWTTSQDITQGPADDTISWLADGRQLAFSDVPPGAAHGSSLKYQVRALDVTGPGTDLMAASHPLLTVKSPASSPSNCWMMVAAPDGGTVICATQYAFLGGGVGTKAGCANGGLGFTAYSAATDKPVRVLYQYRGACSNGLSYVLWTDSSATSIIGLTEIDVSNEGGKQAAQLGVITDGHIRLLKLPKSMSPVFDVTAAF